MLPSGHIAAGALIGARHARASKHPAATIAAAIAAAIVPDLDVVIPKMLDKLGVRHRLESGRHHSWVTHTPLFWAGVLSGARRMSAHADAPAWAPAAVRLLTETIVVHLVQDSVANTVALLWPIRRREYGLGLDRLGGVTDHREYIRRYPASPAGKIEVALMLAALIACRRTFSRAPAT
jgi:LexA-binding, inner membrane-associated putative hydrolase